ncbi:MAG: DNA-processing protein DprA [Peptococcaceae bacterium]|jgi:DNA processing protein|nr:DNA-processing protein DprA [Peptococcaceae bacterium]
MEIQEKMHWMALQATITGQVFPIAKQIVVNYGSLEAFWKAKDTARLPEVSEISREKLLKKKKKTVPEKLWEICDRKKVGVLCCLDEGYPKELLHFLDHPVILYYYGKHSLLNRASSAIVGSRRSTAYGKRMAAVFAEAFARAGLCVASGMAKGIDAAAHEGALAADGDTIAVLGCGVDIVYPPDNRKLYWQIREQGLLISEFFPGEKPLQWHFPMRNRIISGLSLFVLLVEGEARSGALITCDWAAEQGRDIWALPGPVTNPYSIGPLQLIRDGALLAITPEDILRAYDPERFGSPIAGKQGGSEGRSGDALTLKRAAADRKEAQVQQILFSPSKNALASLSVRERKLYEFISYYPIHVDGLLAFYVGNQSDRATGSLFLDLTKLLSLRLIEKLPGDYYQRI